MVELVYVVFRLIWSISRFAVKVVWYTLAALVLGTALLAEAISVAVQQRRKS
jgi:hypothetical protein